MDNLLYQNDSPFEIEAKVIDETRQGEAFVAELPEKAYKNGKKFFIESYGCQMNFADSEVVASILSEAGFDSTADFNNADLILINTCAIRDNAEQRIRKRLQNLNTVKKNRKGALIGVLGCMAERLKEKF